MLQIPQLLLPLSGSSDRIRQTIPLLAEEKNKILAGEVPSRSLKYLCRNWLVADQEIFCGSKRLYSHVNVIN